LIEGCLRGDATELIVDVLVQRGDADLGIVDKIRRVLLHDPQAEVARAQRQVAADLVVRIALWLEVELGQCRLDGQVEEVGRAR